MNPSADSPRNVPSPVACCGWGHWGSETTTLLNTVDALQASATRRDSSVAPTERTRRVPVTVSLHAGTTGYSQAAGTQP